MRRPAVVLLPVLVASVMFVARALPVRPGESVGPRGTILVDGITMMVPPPGHGVWATAIRADGTVRTIGVVADVSGALTEQRVGRVQKGRTTPACSDSAYALEGTSWSQSYKWYFKATSTPSEISQSAATTALRAAAGNITGADNDCGMSDKVSAAYGYQGTTSTPINISSTSTCLNNDGKNVVGFGNLAAGDVAFTCWWTVGGNTVEADVKLNKTEFSWAIDLGGCTNQFSVEAVATHEFGHVFGLAHVSESQHGALTMSPVIAACQSSETTLGAGDIAGLESMY